MKHGLTLGLIPGLLIVLMACSVPPAEQTTAAPTTMPSVRVASTALPAEVMRSLQQFLAQTTGIPAEQITLQHVESVEWNNSCLGITNPNEMCAQVMTPGYRVEFETPRGRYVMHSDRTGRSSRIATSP